MQRFPLAGLALAFAAGVAVADRLPLFDPAWLALAAALVAILSLLSRKKPARATIFLLLAWGVLGALRWHSARFSLREPALNRIPEFAPVTAVGVVAEPARPTRRGSRVVMQLSAIRQPARWQPVAAKVRVYARIRPEKLVTGRRWLVRGNLLRPRARRNPGGFNRLRYEQAQGVAALLIVRGEGWMYPLPADSHNMTSVWALGFRLQQALADRIVRLFHPGAAPILEGMLSGRREDIPEETLTDFRRAGVVHILAVSGLHVGFILLIFWQIARFLRLPRNRLFELVLVGIWLYALVTGLKPPVVRAAVMATAFLLARRLDRPAEGPNLLALAALVLLWFRPGEWFQAGFQLSFAAVAAILYFYPRLRAALDAVTGGGWQRLRFVRAVAELALVSLAAQVGTLPFTLWHFHQASFVGVFTNLVVIPGVFAAICAAVAALPLALLTPLLAWPFVAAADLLILLVKSVAAWGAGFHRAVLENAYPPLPGLIAVYLLLFCLMEWKKVQLRNVLLLGLLATANVALWSAALHPADRLHVTLFDVGQGDAALIETPTGRTLLIDAGPRSPGFDSGERVLLPALRQKHIHRIDAAVLTHPHADHYGGFLSLIGKMPVGEFWLPDTSYREPGFRRLLRLARRQRIPLRILRPGKLPDFAPVEVWCLAPSAAQAHVQRNFNHASIVLQIRYGRTAALFPGDSEISDERRLLAFGALLNSDLLKVGHHGSQTASAEAFLRAVHPKWAAISCGAFNRFGHPHARALQRIRAVGAAVWETRRAGALEWESDGRRFWKIH